MNGQVLIAAELRELLNDDPIPGCDIAWLRSEEPTPSGEFVAVVPLLSRSLGPAELERLPDLRVVANCAVGYDNIDLVAAFKRDYFKLAPYALTVPFYWLLQSIAAYKGLWQLIRNPFYWEKTTHGISKHSEQERRAALEE